MRKRGLISSLLIIAFIFALFGIVGNIETNKVVDTCSIMFTSIIAILIILEEKYK